MAKRLIGTSCATCSRFWAVTTTVSRLVLSDFVLSDLVSRSAGASAKAADVARARLSATAALIVRSTRVVCIRHPPKSGVPALKQKLVNTSNTAFGDFHIEPLSYWRAGPFWLRHTSAR